jgi:Domain of unknown function (DUF4395)
VIDSHLPRFSQAVQATLLAAAFLARSPAIVVAVALMMAAGALGGPRFNLLAHLYRVLPVPRGEPEAAAPPRFSQLLGAGFLALSSTALLLLERGETAWWVLGWGPALTVALLAAVAATTSF